MKFLFENYKDDVMGLAFNMMSTMSDYALNKEPKQNSLPAPSDYVVPENADALFREYAFLRMYQKSLNTLQFKTKLYNLKVSSPWS